MSAQGLQARLEGWLQRQWQTRGVWAWLMAPLALLFGLIVCLRGKIYRLKNQCPSVHTTRTAIGVPILIIGNLYIGGTGKTPVVIALINALKSRGWRPGVISRGYGTHIGPVPLVDQGVLDASLFGDEPALIAQMTRAPIAVHPNRLLACQTLLSRFPEVNLVISDDGLQHLRLPRDIEIVVQDSRGVGNGWLLPAGPLREPVGRLKSVQAILTRLEAPSSPEIRQSALLAGGKSGSEVARKTNISMRICRFRHLSDGQVLNPTSFVSEARALTLAAIAGIASPTRFFSSLQQLGLTLSEQIPLPDHFSYDQSPFGAISADWIIITEKDAVKCQHVPDKRIWVAEVEMIFSDPDFLPWLDHLLQTKSARAAYD